MKKVLFDGTNLDNWYAHRGGPAAWTLADGAMTVSHDDIISRAEYGDAHIHVEFREPDMPDKKGQEKGNSGVYVHGCYEIQVLDSYGIEKPDYGDCSAIYSMYAPLVNACLPALEWQTYDIIFRAPRFDGEEVTECARLTLLHNGKVVHNNILLHRTTPGGVTDKQVARGPLLLQDHGNPVSFRNIWIEEL
jgi:hypothetical protein